MFGVSKGSGTTFFLSLDLMHKYRRETGLFHLIIQKMNFSFKKTATDHSLVDSHMELYGGRDFCACFFKSIDWTEQGAIPVRSHQLRLLSVFLLCHMYAWRDKQEKMVSNWNYLFQFKHGGKYGYLWFLFINISLFDVIYYFSGISSAHYSFCQMSWSIVVAHPNTSHHEPSFARDIHKVLSNQEKQLPQPTYGRFI